MSNYQKSESKYAKWILKRVFTKQAGKRLKYIGVFSTPKGTKEIPIRESPRHHAAVAVHSTRTANSTDDVRCYLSFHARRDLAQPMNKHDLLLQVIDIEYLPAANPQFPPGVDSDLRAHAKIALHATSLGFFSHTISQARTRLSTWFDGEHIPMRVVRKDLATLESLIADMLRREIEAQETVDDCPEPHDGEDSCIDCGLLLNDAGDGRRCPDCLDRVWSLQARFEAARAENASRDDATECKLGVPIPENEDDCPVYSRPDGNILHDRIISVARRSKHLTEPAQVRARERLALYLDGKLINAEILVADVDLLERALTKVEGPDYLTPAGAVDSIQTAVEVAREETQERVRVDARTLTAQWRAESRYELNLAVILMEISQGERDVLKGILEALRKGRGV